MYSYFNLKFDTLIFRYTLENALIAIIFVSGHCHIKKNNGHIINISNIRALDLVVSDNKIFYVLKSQYDQEMPQPLTADNPQHREEESNNNNSHINSVTSNMKLFTTEQQFEHIW